MTRQKIIWMAVIAVAGWAYLVWQVRGQWVHYRRKREVMAAGGVGATGRRWDRRTLLMVILFAGILLAVALSLYVEYRGTPLARARLQEVDAGVRVVMKYLMGVGITLFVLLMFLIWWNRDPSIKKAAKLALADKHAEGEAVIRAAIGAKGPSERRLTVLGLLLMEQNRLEESLEQLQEARRLAKQPGTAKNNCAMVLWKLGRREEGAGLLGEVCAEDPNHFTAVCNSCLILAELGRDTSARERLAQAERIFARYDFRYTKSWVPLLDECRKAAPAAKGFPVVLPSVEAAPNEDTAR